MSILPRSFSPVAVSLLVCGALSAASLGSLAIAEPQKSGLFPLEDVRAGMKGYGLTVMEGTTPEKFDIEVISVLKNFRPNQDLILIKTPNNKRLDAAKTVAGMSGSPIYLEDKMIGAYAYGWQFGAEPIAGVTPIHNMIEDLKKPIPPLFLPRGGLPAKAKVAMSGSDAPTRGPRSFTGEPLAYDFAAHGKQLAAKRDRAGTPTLAPATTPVLFGGLSTSAAAFVTANLAPLGLEALQAGGGGGKVDKAAPTQFVDGGAIGVQLVSGDVSMMGLGTVTRVEGDKLVAFGHPMLGGGASDLPTAIAKVHWILASQSRSFKIGEPVRPLGTLVNDRQASIVIDTKRTASTFPVGVDIQGVDGVPKTKWNMQVSHDPFLSPMFTAMAIGGALETTTPERGDMTWRATSKLKVAGYGTLSFVDFGSGAGDPISADSFGRSRLLRAMGALLNNPWERVSFEGVDMTVKVTFKREYAMLRGTSLVDGEIEPGEPARIKLEIVPFMGKPETKVIEVPIPREYAGEEVEIELAPGFEVDRPRAAPESVADLYAALADVSFPEDSIVATVRLKNEAGAAFRGSVATRLPPGALDTLRTSSTSVGPDMFGAVQQTSHKMNQFVVGRDRVKVRVRPALK